LATLLSLICTGVSNAGECSKEVNTGAAIACIQKLIQSQSEEIKRAATENAGLSDENSRIESKLSELEAQMRTTQATERVDLVSPWYDMKTPRQWSNSEAKCRVARGWIEFRGRHLFEKPISGWSTVKEAILLEECRPKTRRFTEMPCHGSERPRNQVCNNDFYPDGRVFIHSDVPVDQLRFDGVRIWGEEH
jgi:hypothetical protein